MLSGESLIDTLAGQYPPELQNMFRAHARIIIERDRRYNCGQIQMALSALSCHPNWCNTLNILRSDIDELLLHQPECTT